MSFLQIDQLSYKHPENQNYALQNIQFSVEEGQILAIVGESGSGKTTLLKLVAGLLDPLEGHISMDGEQIKGPARQLVAGHPEIKVIFQHFNLSPKINAYQNIAHELRAYTADYREERTRELLSLCKLTGKEERYPYQLSGGEKQRLAIARALAEEPQLLLLDEPFSNLDTMLKAQLKQDLVDMIKESGTTAIVVSHDMGDSLSVADRIAILDQGELIQQNEPLAIYQQPATPYVAQLFGRCNFLEKEKFEQLFPIPASSGNLIGIRAEHLKIQEDGNDHFATGKIIRKQFLGAYYELLVQLEEQTMYIHAYGDAPGLHTEVKLYIQPEHLMVFQATL